MRGTSEEQKGGTTANTKTDIISVRLYLQKAQYKEATPRRTTKGMHPLFRANTMETP